MTTTGERIHLLRKNKGYTLEALAKLVGTSRQTIQRYENGIISNIPAEKLEALASALETSPSVLMGWSEGIITAANDKKEDTVNDLSDEIEKNIGKFDYFVVADKNLCSDDKINRNDIILIRKCEHIDNGDLYLVTLDGKDEISKIYIYEHPKSIMLYCEDKPVIISENEYCRLKIKGKIVGIVHKT
ncbi:MAG: helix-turn-helix transcriptional regulator [Eubacteriales bacterium]|nr:helix-turn-helix transcriptional regulator [Eubacteriales bacterium]